MAQATTPVEIFCSYAQTDEPWLRKLETHLSLLKRQGLITLWHDRLLTAGTDWAKTIDTHLETASVILLLISADFFASDYCYGMEMQRAIARHDAGEARVIPILLRPVDWTDAPFAHLHPLPTDAKPLASWQDEDTALANVVAGLRRAIEELPLLAASAPRTALPKIWNIPYPRNPFFLGRDADLARLRHHLRSGQATALSQPQAISGLGGIGKTQLALEYAYRHHQDYQIVLWARAESTEALTSSYIALAELLQLPEREAKEQDRIVQAVKAWLQTHRDWLLILDNADELVLLQDFLPPGLGGHLLLTTRAMATGRLAHRLEIESLPPEQGALLLLRRATLIAPDTTLEQASSEERELAVQISQELGGLPLALDQAGAYLEETGMDLAGYWQLYQQHRADLLKRRGGVIADHPVPVAMTWTLSFQRVEERNPAAADLLRLCAFLAPDAIAEEILTADASLLGPVLAPVAADAFLLNEAIEALRAYSLVRRDPKEKTLSIHRLVQAVLQESLKETEKHVWVERAMLAVNAAFPHVEYDTWPQCEHLLPQAVRATQIIEQYHFIDEEAGRLLYETALYLQSRARYTEAEPLYQRALRIREQVLGPEHLEVAITLNNLAILFEDQGKYAEAVSLHQRALSIREQTLGSEHPEVAASLNNLAIVYKNRGKYAEAESLYQRALRIREQVLGPEHPAVTITLNNLGLLYYHQARYAEAELLYQQALHIREQVLGPKHPEVAITLNNLAILYKDQGKYAEARSLHQRALSIREQALGSEHPEVAYSLTNLANLCYEQGTYAEAESLYQRALHIRERALGPRHYQLFYPLNGLAVLYYEQGKYEEAEPLYQRALSILEQTVGPEHPDVGTTLTNLADLHREQGAYTKAEALYQRSLHIYEQALGCEHPDVADPLSGLANLYQNQEKYAEAALLYQRALHTREQYLGSGHTKTAELMHNFAQLRETQGHYKETRDLYIRALAIRDQKFGTHHPSTTETRKRLIALLHTMEQHEEAAQFEETHGPDFSR